MRPSTAADGPAIAQLMRDVFGAEASPANLTAAQFQWKYWQQRADWPEPRSFVFERAGAIVAHAGVIPGACLRADARLRVAHVIDWAAVAGAGAGSTLMKRIGRMYDALIAIGGSAQTLALLPALGFKPKGVATGFVRTLRPWRRVAAAPTRSWRLVPQFLRSAIWTAAAPHRRPQGDWRVTRVLEPELASVRLEYPTPHQGSAVLERSEALLRYMLTCPATAAELYRVESPTRAAHGYFLLTSAPAQVRLADCWIASADPQDWRALVQLAVCAAAVRRDAAELVVRANDPLLSRALLDSGFHPRRTDPVQVLTGSASLSEATAVRVQLLDNDAAVAQSEHANFWA